MRYYPDNDRPQSNEDDNKPILLLCVTHKIVIDCAHAAVPSMLHTVVWLWPTKEKPRVTPRNWGAVIASEKQQYIITCCHCNQKAQIRVLRDLYNPPTPKGDYIAVIDEDSNAHLDGRIILRRDYFFLKWL